MCTQAWTKNETPQHRKTVATIPINTRKPWCRREPRDVAVLFQDGGRRHLEFDRTENSAIRSAGLESPSIERNVKRIGSPVAELWPFKIRHITMGAFWTPILREGKVVGGHRSYQWKERCCDSGFLYAPIVTIVQSLTIRSQFAIECLRRSNQRGSVTLGQNFSVFQSTSWWRDDDVTRNWIRKNDCLRRADAGCIPSSIIPQPRTGKSPVAWSPSIRWRLVAPVDTIAICLSKVLFMEHTIAGAIFHYHILNGARWSHCYY